MAAVGGKQTRDWKHVPVQYGKTATELHLIIRAKETLGWPSIVLLCTFRTASSELVRLREITLKILQISSAQSLGGGERHLADLANGLADRGHEIHVALRPKSPLLQEFHAIPARNIHTLPLRNALDAKSARDLARLVKQNEIRIVHAHMARDYPLASYAVAKNPSARLIVTRHVLFRMNRLHRLTLARAVRVIAVSRAVAARIEADGIVRADRISVVLNGIDVAKFQQARADFDRQRFLADWQLPANCLLVGNIGELTPLKGQEEFLQAASQIARQLPKTIFIVAGIDHSSGKKYQIQLEQQIKDLQLTKHVRLVGWVPNLAQLYCALDVFVSSSHTESFGLVLAEAMASGTAVVTTETEGARELVLTNETGLMVPIGDVAQLAEAISRLLTEPDLRTKLSATAHRVAAENFTMQRMISQTEEIYSAGV